MKKEYIMPIVLTVLLLSTAITAVGMARALGRISVLMEQADSAEVVTATALAGEVRAVAETAVSFEEAAEERIEAAIAIAEVRATLIVQEGVAETSFRRAESLSVDNPVLEQAIQEMRGDAIVASMKADSVIAVSAASLLTAQLRIGILERLDGEKDAAHAMTIAAFQAEVRIKDQIIEEQQSLIAPSFITKLFDMPEVALFGVVVGGGLTYMALR